MIRATVYIGAFSGILAALCVCAAMADEFSLFEARLIAVSAVVVVIFLLATVHFR